MKKCVLSICLLCLLTAVSAQRKFECGMVLNGGNFTLPSEKAFGEASFQISERNMKNPGGAFEMGGYYKRALGKYLALSVELLYRRGIYSFTTFYQQRYQGDFSIYSSDTKRGFQMSENSVLAPLKLHCTFKKSGRTAVVLGAGISRTFSTEKIGSTSTIYLSHPKDAFLVTDRPVKNGIGDFNNRLCMMAGVSYRLDAATTLGLNFSYENGRAIHENRSISYPDVFDFGIYLPFVLPDLKSFSLSLHHNLAR